MARQVLNLLEQTDIVGCLGDECSDGKRSDFGDPIGQLRGGVQVSFGMARQYGLEVRRHPAGPDASQEVVRLAQCQTLQVAQELGQFAVPHLFVRLELAHALITGF